MISATFFASVGRLSELPDDIRSHIAIVGRSNVGKSSMINHLAHQKHLARVSGEPGRTQTLNLYDFNGRFFMIDLPGYGYARRSKEQRADFHEMIFDYLDTAPHLKLVLLMIDARIPLSPLDVTMADWLQNHHTPFVIVLNKIDKVKSNDAQALHRNFEARYPGVRRVEHSMNSGKHQREVWGVIETALRAQHAGLPIGLPPMMLED